MSDPLPELPRPDAPLSWRDRLRRGAESLDLTPTRLIVGLVVVAVAGLAAWRLLAPPSLPTEMALPMASSSTNGGGGGGAAAGSGGSGSGGSGAPSSTGEAPTEVVVHVAGAVARPGVQRLALGARVVDAIDAAGGAQPDADLARVNLAAPLEDGQQVYVPRAGEEPPAAPAGGGASAAGGDASGEGSAGATPTGPIDLNSAGVDELDALPGVGPAIAQAIVDHREQNGRFGSVDDLLDVRGIGEAKLDQLRDLVVV